MLAPIKYAAIRNKATGFTVVGENHTQCRQKAGYCRGCNMKRFYEKWEDGFITTEEKFVSREVAWQHAKENSQIDPRRLTYKPSLIQEWLNY